jgi:transcriptional regulator with XRE-family HTH domain
MMPEDAKIVPGESWLRRVAEIEDSMTSMSVGGLINRLGLQPRIEESGTPIFVEFMKLIRRKEGLSVDQLAARANIAVDELKWLELGGPITRDIVKKLAEALKLSSEKLEQLAGIVPALDPELQAAARRFETRINSILVLNPLEESALNDMMRSITR